MGSTGGAGETRLLTVLFGDLVGSTERLAALGDAGPADQVDVLSRFSTAVEAHGGVVVKTLGDGVMATFESPSRAIEAAAAIQVAARRLLAVGGSEPAARVGVSSGEAVHQDGDWAGIPVVEAARLCGAASPGQVLATDLVLALARPSGEVRSVGKLALKGLPAPVSASEVRWQDEVEDRPFPPALATSGLPFRGRAEALDDLRALWGAACQGRGGLVLVAGEPGIGKTRLASELAAEVHADGALVTFGRCDQMPVAELQPFVESMRFLHEVSPGEAADGLRWLLPEVAATSTASPDPGLAQVDLLDGIRQTLAGAASEQAVLVVLDDLHWATEPTLAIVHELAVSMAAQRVLLVATYRDTDVDRVRPFGRFLGELRGLDVTRVALTGLDGAGVADLLAATAGQELGPVGGRLAELVAQATGGNAFFVGELLALLVEKGSLVQDSGEWRVTESLDDLNLPQGVRDVVGQRLLRLPDGADAVLAAAAVIGRSFTVPLLAQVADRGADEVLDALDPAVAGRLVLEDPERPGGFVFAHALVRQVLVDELSTARRLRLHERTGDALVAQPTPSAEALREGAHHLFEAAPLGTIDRAVEAAWASVLVDEETSPGEAPYTSLSLVEVALRAAEDHPPTVAETWGWLLQNGAWASFVAGDRARLSQMMPALLAAARASASPGLFASTVAIGTAGAGFGGDPEYVALLPEALEKVGPTEPARILLLGQRALLDSFFAPDGDVAVRRTELVTAIAEVGAGVDLDDPVVRLQTTASLGIATGGLTWSYLCDADVDAMEASVPAALQSSPTGNLAAFYAAVRRGDVALASERIDALLAHGVERDLAIFEAAAIQNRATLSMLRGDLDDGLRDVDRVREVVPDEPMYAAGCHLQVAWVLYEQGRPAEAMAELDGSGMPYPRPQAAMTGVFALAAGDVDDARRRFDEAWADGSATLGRDWGYPGTLQALAELSAGLGEVERGAEVESLLAPFAGQLILAFCTHVPGSASASLGRLALLRGDEEGGRRLLEEALAFEEEVGAPLHAARTRATLAAI